MFLNKLHLFFARIALFLNFNTIKIFLRSHLISKHIVQYNLHFPGNYLIVPIRK